MSVCGQEGRVYKYDNIRAVLIFLTVLGHLFESLDFPTRDIQYLLIFSFHMPAFAFVSGLCFKKGGGRAFKNILYPYLIFQAAYLIFDHLLTKAPLELQFSTPYWHLWYLPALFLWSLAAGAAEFTEKSGLLILGASAAAALLVGFDDTVGYYLTLSRTVVLFPFFFAGVYVSRFFPGAASGKTRYPLPLRLGVAGAAAGCAAAIAVLGTRIRPEWLYNSYPYSAAGYGLPVRAAFLAAAAVFTAFLTVFVPDRKLPLISSAGRRSAPVYVCHAFILKYAYRGWFEHVPCPFVFAAVFAVLITLALSSGPFSAAVGPLLKWPFERRRAEAEKAGEGK